MKNQEGLSLEEIVGPNETKYLKVIRREFNKISGANYENNIELAEEQNSFIIEFLKLSFIVFYIKMSFTYKSQCIFDLF